MTDDFSRVEDKYELVKIYSSFGDFRNVRTSLVDICNFWGDKVKTDEEREYVFVAECEINKILCDYLDAEIAPFWEHALSKDFNEISYRIADLVKPFFGLRYDGLLKNLDTDYIGRRIEEIKWICLADICDPSKKSH